MRSPGDVRGLAAAVPVVRKYESSMPLPSTIPLDASAGWSPVAWHVLTSADGHTTVSEIAGPLRVTTLTVIEALWGLVREGALSVTWSRQAPRFIELDERQSSAR